MHKPILCFLILSALIAPAGGAVEPATGPMYRGHASREADQWQRIDFRLEKVALRNASQIKIAIQTKGPPKQGLVRIPGSLASNFDTGKGMTVVELINVGEKTKGYANIVALDVLFTQAAPGQLFWVLTVDYVDVDE
jgi:hypothetical protein